MTASTMRRACLLALVCCVCASLCYPSKPLNERSTELAWEAWLLMDQSNRPSDPGLARRKITPKSIFFVPTFSPETLPPCSEGYKSDPKGRCVNIFQVDPVVHDKFTLQKLINRFSGTTTEAPATTGPFQVNIPFEVESDTEVALLVAPSDNREKNRTSVKVDVKRNDGDKFDVEDVAAILRVKPESVEMTTIAELSTTMAEAVTTEEEEDATTTEMATAATTTTTTTTTTMDMSTMPLEGDAIFFQVRV